MSNLKDQQSLFDNKFYPMVKKWLVTLTKAGENCDSHFLRKIIDLKRTFDNTEIKLKPFERVLKMKLKQVNNIESDNSDDENADDFIEVQEKSGYEAAVRAEDHLLGIDFYSRPSTSKGVTPIQPIKQNTAIRLKKPIPLNPEEYIEENQVKPQKILANPDFVCKWSLPREEDVIELQGPATIPVEIPGTV